jgi:hypothetical protein
MKIKASLEGVNTRKDVSDNIIYKVVLTVYPTSEEEIAQIMKFYRRPIEISIEESQ